MKVIVCGGRDFEDRDFVFKALDQIHGQIDFSTVIHGACPTGADRLADDWAKSRGDITTWRFPANWRKHGKAAGPIRNREMIEKGNPSLVIAFPGGKGTTNMLSLAAEYGLDTIEAFPGDTTAEDREVAEIQAAVRSGALPVGSVIRK